MVETMAQTAAALAHQLGAVLLASVVGKNFPVWWAHPTRAFPLARLPDADAETLGARPGVRVAYLSPETAAKQRRAHPELTPAEYTQAQRVIDQARVRVLEEQTTGTRDLIYVLDEPPDGYVLIVKATRTGDELWVKTFYRLRRDQALRDREIRRLLRKGEKK
jgi:nitrate reductase alpha subunit